MDDDSDANKSHNSAVQKIMTYPMIGLQMR